MSPRSEVCYWLYTSSIHIVLCLVSVMAVLQRLRITGVTGFNRREDWRIATGNRPIDRPADSGWSHGARPLVLVGPPPTMWICTHGLTS